MKVFLKICSVFLILTGWSCQPNPPEEVQTGEVADTLTYSFSTIEKNIPCKGEEGKTCLDIYIEKLKMDGGTSDEALADIEKTLLKAISESDNAGGQSKSPEKIAENLEVEYTRISQEMPDFNIPWQYKSEFEVYLNQNGLFAVKLINYSYTGGAHPITYKTYFTFDKENGKLITLRDLIQPKRYNELLRMAEAELRDSRGVDSTETLEEAGFQFSDNRFTLNDNYKYTPKGIEILFNPYEIASYSEGEIVLMFPYSAIEPMVRPEYRFLVSDPVL